MNTPQLRGGATLEKAGVTCYLTPGKEKSLNVLRAFAEGAEGGGRILSGGERVLGPVAFYGVVPFTRPILESAKQKGVDWYYLDNAYFDCVRGAQFRITKNAFQTDGKGRPDWQRFAALGLGVMPWRKQGRHIILVVQSNEFHIRACGMSAQAWVEQITRNIRGVTKRNIIVRHWSRRKRFLNKSLQVQLRDAWALVTHASAAANEALIAGVPVFTTGPCAASSLSSGPLTEIASPRYPDGRLEWAASLAAQQWTLDEMRSGVAWRALNGLG